MIMLVLRTIGTVDAPALAPPFWHQYPNLLPYRDTLDMTIGCEPNPTQSNPSANPSHDPKGVQGGLSLIWRQSQDKGQCH